MCDNPSLESRVEEAFPGKTRMSCSEVIWGQSVLSVGRARAKALRWEGACAHKLLREGLAEDICSASIRMCRPVILGSHQGTSSHHSQIAPLPSPHHKESLWIWESSSKAAQNIINIQQKETIRQSSRCRKITDSLPVINWR